MATRSPILEETLKRIRSGEKPDGSKKRKRTSRILLAVDAVLIIVILIFFYNRQPQSLYRSSTFNYKGTAIRFSVSGDKTTGNYLFSLTMQSRSTEPVVIRCEKNAGTITLRSGDTVIVSEPVGEDITAIKLAPEENRSMARIIEKKVINEFALAHPEKVKEVKRTLIQFEKRHVPVQADLTLNTKDPITVTLEFNHGVKE
ncbi:MAG TPA: hypothetical protein PK926_15900 [Spirochaetota bacterium]|nr:hypothetical protein [Spirochaetota bacterium]HPI91033.1 hypothetical protein [Spirochaetota bacterium]HPR47647.1 hypothetical protein [Spirochaetota bacterium]